MAIAHLVTLEVVHMIDAVLRTGVLPSLRKRAVVATLNVEVIVDMAAEIARAMEPRTRADEDAAAKPLRTIEAIRSAAIWRIVVITVGTYRRYADADLGRSAGRSRDAKTSCSRGKSKVS